MKLNGKIFKAGIAAVILASLTACGGGGGGGNDSPDPTPDPTPDPVSKAFSVKLASVKVLRVSNGEAVEVDTSEVDSGELEYTP